MRTRITIVFETHGLGTVEQHNDWNEDLLEKAKMRGPCRRWDQRRLSRRGTDIP
jgi:hypothetical protein